MNIVVVVGNSCKNEKNDAYLLDKQDKLHPPHHFFFASHHGCGVVVTAINSLLMGAPVHCGYVVAQRVLAS